MKINLHTTDSDLTQPPLPPPSTFIPMRFARRGGKKTIIRPDEEAAQLFSHPILPNQPLLTSLARSFYWQKLLDDGVASSGSDIAATPCPAISSRPSSWPFSTGAGIGVS